MLMMKTIQIRVLCLLIIIVNSVIGAFMRNKYNVDVQSIQKCDNNAQMESPLRNFKYVKMNRTHKFLSYDITYRRPLDEHVGNAILVDRWGDGGWINVPFMPFQPNMCKNVLRYFPKIWIGYQGAMGVKQPERCPVPAVGELFHEKLRCRSEFCHGAILEWTVSIHKFGTIGRVEEKYLLHRLHCRDNGTILKFFDA